MGEGYGAEPPDVDPEYGRVSYTQFEFLYARHQSEKTWVIVIGKGFARDKLPDQLDLPRESAIQTRRIPGRAANDPPGLLLDAHEKTISPILRTTTSSWVKSACAC